jgi:hypothetical protein
MRIGKNMLVLFVDVCSIDIPRNWIVAFTAPQKSSFLRIIALLGMGLLSLVHSQAWAFSRLQTVPCSCFWPLRQIEHLPTVHSATKRYLKVTYLLQKSQNMC